MKPPTKSLISATRSLPAQSDPVIEWLMSGDVAVQYQTMRDLLNDDQCALQDRIAKEGWGLRILECRNTDGTWGQSFLKPQWAATHYTLLKLKQLQIAPATTGILGAILETAGENIAADGGLGDGPGCKKSDVCINGMFLNYACYFGIPERPIRSIVDFLLDVKMQDGGFNCACNRAGAHHSSLHSTLSVLEGFCEYAKSGHTYRIAEMRAAVASAQEFILQHRLFKSDRTGKVINPDFLKMPYPPRWRNNVLRALDYFRDAAVPYDHRMQDALDKVLIRRRPDYRWPREAMLPGKVHFAMEPPRGPSRWNTLMALRVLTTYSNLGSNKVNVEPDLAIGTAPRAAGIRQPPRPTQWPMIAV